MTFTVRGADPATGMEVVVPVEAASAAEAEATANARGLYVAAVEVTAAQPAAASPQQSFAAQPSRRGGQLSLSARRWLEKGSATRRRILLCAGGTVVLVPLLVWWMNVKDRLFPGDLPTPRVDSRTVDVSTNNDTPPGGQGVHGQTGVGTVAVSADRLPRRRTDGDLRALFSGTFGAPANAKTDLSITFNYPRYVLNPSRTGIWAAGTTGTWEVVTDHPALTAAQRAEGWYVLTMTPPDDPGTPIPAHVRFGFDDRGRVTDVRFASFLGVKFPSEKQMILARMDQPSEAVPAEQPAARSEPADVVKPGLERAGYAKNRCLICRDIRSLASRGLYSDKRGFGLCEDCGRGYQAWERVLASVQAGFRPTTSDQASVDEFKGTLERNFNRNDEEGRRGMGLIFLMGKFASPEWHSLTGTD